MFTLREILKATGGKVISGDGERISGISVDSRTIKTGELFIALKGKNFDGHNFVGEAVKKGSVGAVVCVGATRRAAPTSVAIEVPDTLAALGDIAHFHRMRFDIPVIGITGSNGKTTTKDMTAQALQTRYSVLKNKGTLNNLIGVPLTLLNLNSQHDVCVLEMGTSRLGEIKRLAEIAKPNIAVITNVGPSHLEFFKDLKTVSSAKMELFEDFKGDDTAIWNFDDVMLKGLHRSLHCKKKTFGFLNGCDFQATDIEWIEGGFRFAINRDKVIKINLLGRHNIYNALASIAVSDIFQLSYDDMSSALSNFRTPSMRMELQKAGGITIIKDCYNSNPKSMESAISALSDFNTKGKKVLISGDMLELGEDSKYFHDRLGREIAIAGIDIFIAVGLLSEEAALSAIKAGMSSDSVLFCKDAIEAGERLLKILCSGDVVLIKGSRAMRMERICSTICSIH